MGYNTIEFDKKSKFLITGCAGFIGSNLAEYLLKQGHFVRGLDNMSNGLESNLTILREYPTFEFIQGDITDLDTCILATKDIDYVSHQAAWGSVPRSIEMPVFYEEVNIKGTLNMLEASRQNAVKKFVYASSSSVYGDEPNLPKFEGREGNLLSPYALTKSVNEEYAKLYKTLYGLDTYGLRYFNVFGRRQNPNGSYAAVLPKFIEKVLNDETIQINGDGLQSRDFTYIENVIEANLKCFKATSESGGQAMNIAYGGQETLMSVIKYIEEILKVEISYEHLPDRKGDIKHSNADISKAKKLIGYDPSYSFTEGLEEYISWFLKNRKEKENA